jgi:tRNA A37 threonylcarbamoyladenosine dehydratase
MGAGNKLDPTLFRVSDIYDTKVCPLAKIIRKKVREMGIDHLKVVYSEETPIDSSSSAEKKVSGRPVPGSISFIPSVVGLIIAGEVIKDISGLSFSKS